MDTFTVDRIDYYFDKAYEVYCDLKSVSPDEITEEQLQEINLYAGNHIGFFLAWVIKHDFIGELHDDDSEAVQQVKDEKMTGTEFLIDYCDTKFWSEDVADELVPFLQSYYQESYFQDYCQWVIEDLCDLPMEFIGTWEDYHEFEPVINRAYEAYCAANGK